MSRYAMMLHLHVDERCSVAELVEWFELSPRWVREVLHDLGRDRAAGES